MGLLLWSVVVIVVVVVKWCMASVSFVPVLENSPCCFLSLQTDWWIRFLNEWYHSSPTKMVHYHFFVCHSWHLWISKCEARERNDDKVCHLKGATISHDGNMFVQQWHSTEGSFLWKTQSGRSEPEGCKAPPKQYHHSFATSILHIIITERRIYMVSYSPTTRSTALDLFSNHVSRVL